MTNDRGMLHPAQGGANQVEQVERTTPAKPLHLSPSPFRGRCSGAVEQGRRTEVEQSLLLLARQVERLAPPTHRYPERFWEDKSELAHALRTLAKGGR